MGVRRLCVGALAAGASAFVAAVWWFPDEALQSAGWAMLGVVCVEWLSRHVPVRI